MRCNCVGINTTCERCIENERNDCPICAEVERMREQIKHLMLCADTLACAASEQQYTLWSMGWVTTTGSSIATARRHQYHAVDRAILDVFKVLDIVRFGGVPVLLTEGRGED